MRPDTIRCWSKGGPQNEVWNWGDAISPILFELVTGHTPKILDYRDLSCEPHIMICGSTVKWATSGSLLWGVGEIAEDLPFVIPGVRPLHVAAVRGPLTRQRLLNDGIDCPDIFGDPALLFPRYYRPQRRAEYLLGVVPHYIDVDLQCLEPLKRDPRVRIIDITQAHLPIESRVFSFIDDILSCQNIVSSSLHGLIVADAYGLPSKWTRLSDRVFGNGYKFHDYFRSVDHGGRAEAALMGLGGCDEIVAGIRADFMKFGPIEPNIDRLLNAFPGSQKEA